MISPELGLYTKINSQSIDTKPRASAHFTGFSNGGQVRYGPLASRALSPSGAITLFVQFSFSRVTKYAESKKAALDGTFLHIRSDSIWHRAFGARCFLTFILIKSGMDFSFFFWRIVLLREGQVTCDGIRDWSTSLAAALANNRFPLALFQECAAEQRLSTPLAHRDP